MLYEFLRERIVVFGSAGTDLETKRGLSLASWTRSLIFKLLWATISKTSVGFTHMTSFYFEMSLKPKIWGL